MSDERLDSQIRGQKLSRKEFIQSSIFFGLGLGLAFFQKNSARAEDAPQESFQVFLPMISNEHPQLRGLSYSPYRDGQNPDWGPYPNENQIKMDIGILDRITEYIRTYGSDRGFDNIPRLITDIGSTIKVNAGCYLGTDYGMNDDLVAKLIAEVNQFPNVISATVGNETQQFSTIPEADLINYIAHTKQQIRPGVTVTTGETWYAWAQHPSLVNAVDYVSCHIFPYWEAVPLNNAVAFVQEKYELLRSLYPTKHIVIGETGWPSAGDAIGGAIPSLENQRQYINEFLAWAIHNKVDFYMFEGFDEAWKKRYEGEVGGHWGIFNSDRTPKHPGYSLK